MPRIDWALACALAFFDREDRLCLVGITRHLPVPHLPLAIPDLMLVAKLGDVALDEEREIGVALMAPSGLWTRPTSDDGIVIEIAGDYLLITLRGIPLMEEGVHAFHISLSGQLAAAIELPVLTAASSLEVGLH